MTVAELRESLSHFDENLPVFIRCNWEGDEPASNVFDPRMVTQDMDHDTTEDFISIECDQEV